MYQTGEQGDESTVGPGESWTVDLAAEYGELVSQYEDLRILGGGIQPVDTNGLEDVPDVTLEERQGHGG